ncbi:MAG: BrnT family toxin [Bryobacteraceae bacterium]
MRFTWDPEKAKTNLRKHGVSFETAVEVFSDPNQIAGGNYFVEGEQRLQMIGMTRNLVLLLVVFVEHSDEEVEIAHIISARKAQAYEQSRYEDQFR